MGSNIDHLTDLAAANDAAAQVELGHRYQSEGRNDLARGWFARGAQNGNLAGLRLLATSLLAHPPFDLARGMNLLRGAAGQGDPDATHLCAVIAGQDTQLADNWRTALDYLAQAAERGSTSARAQLCLLADDNGQIDIARWLRPAPARPICDSPLIAVSEGFATAAECDWLIARARPRLKPAEVYDPRGAGGFRASGMRNNSDASFGLTQSDLVMTLVRARIAQWSGLSSDDMEPLSVLHYTPGQYFAPHFDFIDPDNPRLAPSIARLGQRRATVLVYLNDDFESGETEFCDLGIRFRGRKGDALLFWNVGPDGQPDRRTRHAGRAPTRGEKWLLSQWIRGR